MVSLTDRMRFFGITPDVTVQDGISTRSGAINGLMCFRYSNSITPVQPPLSPVPSGQEEQPEPTQTATSSIPQQTATTSISQQSSTPTPTPVQQQPRRPRARNLLQFLRNQLQRLANFLGGGFLQKRNLIEFIRSQVFKKEKLSPDAHDRKDKCKLRAPKQIPIDFLKRWMYSERRISKVRKREEQIKKFTDFINTFPITFQTSLERYEEGNRYGWRPKTDEEVVADDKITQTLVHAFLKQE